MIFSDFYSILCMKNISWNCYNIYSKCDLRNILATTSICNKKHRHLVYAKKWTLNMSCFCQNNRKVYFRASKAGELLTFLLLQNGPIHSTVNTNTCWYNILTTLDLQFCRHWLCFVGQYFRSFLWRWHYYIENTVWIVIVIFLDTYPFLFWLIKFIYSEKATNFCKISTVDLSDVVTIKYMVEISQNLVAFSEYMNFKFLYLGSKKGNVLIKTKKYIYRSRKKLFQIHKFIRFEKKYIFWSMLCCVDEWQANAFRKRICFPCNFMDGRRFTKRVPF